MIPAAHGVSFYAQPYKHFQPFTSFRMPSAQWQYYIWLVVVLRLLLPFGPEVNLLGKTYQAVDQAITQAASLPSQRPAANPSGDISAPAVGLEQGRENGSSPAEDLTTVHPLQEIWVLLKNYVWLVWLVAALGLLIRKATVYDRQVFKSWYRSQSVCIGLTQAAASCARTVQHCAGVVVFCHYHAKVVGIKLLFTGQECVELRIP